MITFRFLVLSIFLPSFAFGLGIDHPPGDLPAHDRWSQKLYDSVNTQERVSGYWINGIDRLFYVGDNVKLKTMIENISNVADARVEIVLHPGPGVARSAYDIKAIGPADWSVMVGRGLRKPDTPNSIRIDIWLGRSITLDKLKVPTTAAVSSTGEIEDLEKFVRAHKSANPMNGKR